MPAAISARVGRRPSLRASPGRHRSISSPGRGAIRAPTARRPASGRSPTADPRRHHGIVGGPQPPPPVPVEIRWRRAAPPASSSPARRAAVSAVGSAGQQDPSSRGLVLGQRSVPGLLPNTRLHRTGAQGSGLTRRGRAPILVGDGAAAWFRVAPAAEPQSLGNIPPQQIEGTDPSGGDPNRVRSAVTLMRFARVPSRHQLAGPGNPRCPSGPAAGIRPVADGRRQAGMVASLGAAATVPRPGRRPSGRAVPAGMVAGGPSSPDFGSAPGRPAGVVVAGFPAGPTGGARAVA